MDWRKYAALPAAGKRDESYYIIGLDIGNETTGLAFYNLHDNSPEPIDLSGGYGKPSVPTVMQYIPETKEWVFGEYAILNQGSGTEINLQSLVSQLGRFEQVTIDRREIRVSALLGLFIKELLGNVRNINPKAEIVGIIAAIPEKLSNDGQEELRQAFRQAGYEKELIALVPSRECVLAYHYRNHPLKQEKLLLLDYGSQEVRGGVYSIAASKAETKATVPAHNPSHDKRFHINDITIPTAASAIPATAVSCIFDDKIGTGHIWHDVFALFESHCHAGYHNTRNDENHTKKTGVTSPANHTRKAEDTNTTPTTYHQQLTAFTYQHKDMLFQKNIRTKPAKLYYNFIYPPVQQTITHTQIEQLAAPYNQRFTRLIQDNLEKNTLGRPIHPRDINAVLCVGGGFEMLWAREAIANIFEKSQIHMYRNAKLFTAEGAAQVAANLLGITPGYTFEIEDNHQLEVEIGIKAGDIFLPLAMNGAYWWQSHQSKLVLVNKKVDGQLSLSITQRTATGDKELATHNLTGLPKRPKGTTRLIFDIDFASNTRLTLKITDAGFGELFPKSSYKQEFAIQLA